MLIAIDIGNSSINIGYFTENDFFATKIPTNPLLSSGEYRKFLEEQIQRKFPSDTNVHCIISSVVPSHTRVMQEAVSGLLDTHAGGVLILGHDTETGIPLSVRMPESLGTDRIANAAGAFSRYGAAVAVADFGTATTLTLVGKDGSLIGGAILPGIGMMNESLSQRASQLRSVRIDAPVSALGKDTESCIRSGILFGSAGAVERIISEIEVEEGYEFRVVITGGYSEPAGRCMKRPHLRDPHLTLEGLRIIYGKNRPA